MRRTVTDPADPALDAFRRLTDAEWRRSAEAAWGLCIAESLHVVRRVLEICPMAVRQVLVTEHAAARLAEVLDAAAEVLVVEPTLLAAVAGFPVHRGVLASVDRPAPRPVEAVAGSAQRLAVLEDLTDQANLGALFRSASALGIDALLLSPRCADPLYRRSVRTSMGEVFRLPWARLGSLTEAAPMLRRHGYELVALTPAGDQAPAVPASGDRVAVLLGSEADGLSAEALALADRRVRIPMRPGVDSLNAAAAAAVAFAVYGLVPDQ